MNNNTTAEERLEYFLEDISVISFDKPRLIERNKEFAEFWRHIQINRKDLTKAILAFGEQERRLAALDIKKQIDQCGNEHSGVRKPLKNYICKTYLAAE